MPCNFKIKKGNIRKKIGNINDRIGDVILYKLNN